MEQLKLFISLAGMTVFAIFAWRITGKDYIKGRREGFRSGYKSGLARGWVQGYFQKLKDNSVLRAKNGQFKKVEK